MKRTKWIVITVSAPFILIGMGLIIGWIVDGQDAEGGWLILVLGIMFFVGGLLPLRLLRGTGPLGQLLSRMDEEEQDATRLEALRTTGRQGTALVTSVEDTGISRVHEYRLRVQVTIELDGGGSYASEATRMFKVVALPRGGDRYRVHVDPHDQHRWLLDTSRRLSDA
jgi:hypothetical protein